MPFSVRQGISSIAGLLIVMNLPVMLGILWWAGLVVAESKPMKKGFDLGNATIPLKDIKDGGPRRDGIPAINDPVFQSISETNYLKEEDLVMSMTHRGMTRAYPIRILNFHEIVNDTIEDLDFAVTYCPLCGTGMVFDRTIDGEVTSFGVSGLLYQSDVLLYDRASESLWSQLMMKSVLGSRVGMELKWLASEFMTWTSWGKRYPKGEVLSDNTGYHRNYRTTPYIGYEKSDTLYFPVPHYRDDLGIKALILGIEVDGIATAYDVNLFTACRTYVDQLGERTVKVRFDSETHFAEVIDGESGEAIPHVFAFWFAWQAFHPGTRLLSTKRAIERDDDL